MAANQPQWPREWLMTDERMSDRLWEAIEALPPGAGIVFRHNATPEAERAALARRVARLCEGRGLMLAVARNIDLATSLDAALVHNPMTGPGLLPLSRSAHSADEAQAAIDAGASLIFLSPIHWTRSHPELQALPRDTARQIVAASPVPVIALGGMNRARFNELEGDGYYGWAGIDAWLGEIRT
jgi:thiamine-phosphate pyrophosphorylase